MAISKSKAVSAIEKRGALLVYPLQNRAEPLSLWSELFPRSKMRWEWDENGDSKVADLWHIRAVLSASGQVVYVKWYQNRATFFSLDVARDLIAYLRPVGGGHNGGRVARADEDLDFSSDESDGREFFTRPSREVIDVLEMDSPLSTKQLKEAVGLQGKMLEGAYEKSLRPLWRRLWIVGFGEVEDSSFPSLAVGSTRLLFEDLWNEAMTVDASKAEKRLAAKLGDDNLFWKFAQKVKKS